MNNDNQGNAPKEYEILTGGEAQRKYGLYAENKPVIQLNADNVPEHLRGLIPMAEKWGIGDDIIRGDYISKSV